jgi:Protein of unknown function (DUF4019)
VQPGPGPSALEGSRVPSYDSGEYQIDQSQDEPEQSRSGIWLLILIVVLLSVIMVSYGVYHSNEYANDLSTTLLAQFHGILEEHDYQRIYSEADPEFKARNTPEAVNTMLSNITTRMGAPASSKIVSKNMERAEHGSYLHAKFETNFTNEQRAYEIITWHETDGIYRIYQYEIQPIGK